MVQLGASHRSRGVAEEALDSLGVGRPPFETGDERGDVRLRIHVSRHATLHAKLLPLRVQLADQDAVINALDQKFFKLSSDCFFQ